MKSNTKKITKTEKITKKEKSVEVVPARPQSEDTTKIIEDFNKFHGNHHL
jgi:hypothetical protein